MLNQQELLTLTQATLMITVEQPQYYHLLIMTLKLIQMAIRFIIIQTWLLVVDKLVMNNKLLVIKLVTMGQLLSSRFALSILIPQTKLRQQLVIMPVIMPQLIRFLTRHIQLVVCAMQMHKTM